MCFLLSEFKIKTKYRKCLKILTTKQMLQTLPIALCASKSK